MIILRPYEPRLLPQVPVREWREPSSAQAKDMFGNQNRTRFRVRARLDDGYVRWAGWFDSREDFDAFLWAIVLGTLDQTPELWRLPTPGWYPGIGEGTTFDFATVTFLTTPIGSLNTYTSASDWNNSNNTVEVVAAGGSAGVASGIGANNHCPGGGGGEYGTITNFTFATPGTTTAQWQVGAGGPSKSVSATNSASGTNGGSSWFNGATQGASSVGAIFGQGAATYTGSGTGGPGGTGGVGTTHKAGGAGGDLTGSSGYGAAGGGGAGGATGAGVAGVSSSSTSNAVTTAGGAGDGGSGGAGSAGSSTTSSAGGSGTEWDGSHGSGGGSGGASASASAVTSGTAGAYGAGSGGAKTFGNFTSTSGKAGDGIVVLTYTPAVRIGFNMAMLGM